MRFLEVADPFVLALDDGGRLTAPAPFRLGSKKRRALGIDGYRVGLAQGQRLPELRQV